MNAIINQKIKHDNLRMEKKAIYEASLKLLSEGKFHASSLAEIAFEAKLSWTSIIFVFETRDKLLQEMSEHVTQEIHHTIDEAVRPHPEHKERFFALWKALNRYYSQHPNAIAFVEQFENLKSLPHAGKIVHPAMSTPLIDLFTPQEINDDDRRETAIMFAAIFHANVLSAAKIAAAEKTISDTLPDKNLEIL